jgi:hypothetical protein
MGGEFGLAVLHFGADILLFALQLLQLLARLRVRMRSREAMRCTETTHKGKCSQINAGTMECHLFGRPLDGGQNIKHVLVVPKSTT